MVNTFIFTSNNTPASKAQVELFSKTYSITTSSISKISEIEVDGFYLEVADKARLHYLNLGDRISVEVDFLKGEVFHRIKTFSKKQSLAKALYYQIGDNEKLRVIDATGGFGGDAACMASLGLDVSIFERNPLVYCVLKAGIEQAKNDDRFNTVFEGKIDCYYKDSMLALKNLTHIPDAIYLDPMYPERKKNALSKKKMQILQKLIGMDTDREELLRVAVRSGVKKVVVKRPPDIKPIDAENLTISFQDKMTCFDVYLRKN